MEPRRTPRFVFVVTYGRSGSTLTQGLLNTIPRTLVRGENGLFILPLFRAYASLKDFRRRHGQDRSDRETSAFYGLRATDPDQLAADIGAMVQHQLLGPVPVDEVDRLGFKEVLWHRIPERAWPAMFDFMDLAFDEPLYVLNQRDVEVTSTSGFWRQQPAEARTQIAQVEGLQQHLRDSRPGRTVDTRYEEVTSHDEQVASGQLRRLAEFVSGSCDDDLLAAMLRTRETGYGPNPFGKSRLT